MAWDYSIYPKLTKKQKEVFTSAGETLYMIQMAEQAIQICITFALGGQKQLSLEKIYSEQEKNRKKTIGQLLFPLRKKIYIHPDFDSILVSFVEKRNFFVHTIFNDLKYGLTSDELCETTNQFLLDLQDFAWNVQNVFLGCLINWAKESGVYDHLPEEIKNNRHLFQVQEKSFHWLFQKSPDEIRVRWVTQQPN